MIFGYLDPGSGSLILQAVVGGLTGLGVAVKAWRSKYRPARGKGADEPEENEAVEDTALNTES